MRCENLIFEFEVEMCCTRNNTHSGEPSSALSDHVTALLWLLFSPSSTWAHSRAFPWTYCRAGYHLHTRKSESRAVEEDGKTKWMEALREEGEVVRGWRWWDEMKKKEKQKKTNTRRDDDDDGGREATKKKVRLCKFNWNCSFTFNKHIHLLVSLIPLFRLRFFCCWFAPHCLHNSLSSLSLLLFFRNKILRTFRF